MATVRQRKKTDPAPEKGGGGDATKNATSKTTKKPHVPTWKDWIPIFALMGVAACILLGSYSRYGPTMLLGQGWRDLKMTSEDWQSHLTSHTGDAAGRKLVFIGGPHRGGTTYIWHGAACSQNDFRFFSIFTELLLGECKLFCPPFPHGYSVEQCASHTQPSNIRPCRPCVTHDDDDDKNTTPTFPPPSPLHRHPQHMHAPRYYLEGQRMK